MTASVVVPLALAVRAPRSTVLPSIVPDLVKPVPLMVIDWPGAAVAGTTVRARETTSRLKFAAFKAEPTSVMVTLWVPTLVAAGTTNLKGVSEEVLPLLLTAVTPVRSAVVSPPIFTAPGSEKVSKAVKSTRSTVTVPPGEAVVDRGVAPAFWTKAVVAFSLTPAESVTQTNPPAEVLESRVIVPENTPLASTEPDPLKSVPPAPVVGAVTFWGFSLILQSVQLAVNPPPVTVTVAPRAAVDGV